MHLEETGVSLYYYGALGNQMFVIAAAYSISKAYSCPLYLPKYTKSPNEFNQLKHVYTDSIFRYFGIHTPYTTDEITQILLNKSYRKVSYPSPFSPWSYSDHTPGVILDSYYQFYPPIQPYEDEIRQLFLKGLESCRETIRKSYDFSNAAFLHIRRGDYLLSPNHFVLPIEYYKLAINKLLHTDSPPSHIYVISDDFPWILEQEFIRANPIFHPVDLPDELDSLALMSLCSNGAICANSTFSWWGAFLGSYSVKNPVYVPEKWVYEPTVSLFPPEWITISME